ncbi:MAG: hypothetical protein HY986_09615 [Candidatus Melainabacteria bacterium]|nr:hypothetical protein [Candidatus Melainabacteria bacterium]
MYEKFYNALETRFGTNNAVKVMLGITVLALIGVIASFQAGFFMVVFALSTVVTPIVIGLVYAVTWGHVNLAVFIDNWLFNSTEGMVVGIVLIVVAAAIILYQFPDAINRWASGKIFTK